MRVESVAIDPQVSKRPLAVQISGVIKFESISWKLNSTG